MDHMKFESPDMVQGNIEKIEALFPNCVTETRGEDGKLRKAVNFDLLRQMLSGEVAEGDEAYEFTWVGKKAAIVEANKPIRKALRPCPEESVNWDTTENLYIEGDNLEVLKLLQESYLGKVKLIYIDPPYNTGNDFIYRDDFAMKSDEYEEQLGVFDEETGERLFKNTDSNGRFHSDWCSMIYSRLMLARNLLSDDGIICISIDDNEVKNLLEVCNEVFGEDNYIATMAWQRTLTRRNDAKKISFAHEYIVIYAKKYDLVLIKNEDAGEKQRATYSNRDNDPRGDWLAVPFHAPNIRPNLTYPIVLPSGREVFPPVGRCWSTTKDKYIELVNDNRIYFGKDGNGMPQRKKFWNERSNDEGVVPWTWWPYDYAGENREATKEFKDIFDDATLFNGPKPTKLLCRIIDLIDTKNSIVLDFFSGSASTAHAVLKQNAADDGRRKYIMVQLPEKCEEKSEAYKAGYNNICEIGKERIRRAGQKLQSALFEEGGNYRHVAKAIQSGEQRTLFNDGKPVATIPVIPPRWSKMDETEDNKAMAQALDIGFRVLKLADSNMNNVYYSAGEYGQQKLDDMESKIKSDRTELDLLFGCLLDWGLPLSLPYKSETIDGCTIHTYAPGDPDLEIRDALIACFDEKVPTNVIETIARRNPLRAVFREECFTSSPDKINVFETFKRLAQGTAVKVI